MISITDPDIEAYAQAHSSGVPDLMDQLQSYTQTHMDLPQMLVGPLEGQLLKVLVRATAARCVLEVGTFTGYSALMMAAGLPDDGTLTTLELEDRHADVAQLFFDRSPHGHKITLLRGLALDRLARLKGPLDLAFIDADKANYVAYFEAIRPLMRPGGLIIVDNVLWNGRVLNPNTQDESTRAIQAFNDHLRREEALDHVLLTVRDGMTLVVVG